MAGSAQIRAGQAYWEATLRDKTGPGFDAIKKKLERLKEQGAIQTLGKAFTQLGKGLAAVGATFAAAGGGITAVMAKSVQTFMEVSKFAKDTGKSIAGIDPSKAEKLAAAWDTLKATFGAIQFLIGSALAEPLTRILHLFISVGVQVAKFVRDNQQLVVVVAAVGAGLLAVGVAMATFGAALAAAGGVLAAIVAGIAALATPAGIVTTVLAGIVALVVGGVAAWFAFTDAGRDAATGIAAALANADIPGAWNLILQSMSTMWAQWSDFVVSTIASVAKKVIEIWESAVKTIANVMTDAGVFNAHAHEGEAKKLREQQIARNNRRVQDLQSAKDQALANGGSVTLPSGQSRTVAELDREINDILKNNAALNASRGGPAALNDAATAIDQQVSGWAAPLKKFFEEMEATAANARQAAEDDLHQSSENQKSQLKTRLKGIADFSGMVGGGLHPFGGSKGTFSGAGASLFGIGSGGGQKVHDDKAHDILERIIKAVNGIEVESTFG